jgi:hypothetical protein
LEQSEKPSFLSCVYKEKKKKKEEGVCVTWDGGHFGKKSQQ